MRFTAPEVSAPDVRVRADAGIRRLEPAGESYVRTVGKILEVRLVGSPDRIGAAHSALLRPEMIETERAVWELLDRFVPNRWARQLLLRLAPRRYRRLDSGIATARLREIAAQAAAFSPDPWAGRFDTYTRFVYLNALYDISLSFERSPLVGCTSICFSTTEDGTGAWLARNFDMEVHDVFDERKALFLVREEGAIPFASVAWPGLVGVVSGMNLEGVAVVVHGARAGRPRTIGEPVTHALRRVLSEARNTREAIQLLAAGTPMMSHLVVVADAEGALAAVERVPGSPPHVRPLGSRASVTNHLEGPHASDRANRRVAKTTSTLARRARADELVAGCKQPTAPSAVAMLRDRNAAGGAPLPDGDRRAIDAGIATHGVVMNTSDRTLWVSEAPHLSGRFVRFDLGVLLSDTFDPAPDDPAPDAIP